MKASYNALRKFERPGGPATTRSNAEWTIWLRAADLSFNTVHNIQADVPPENIMAMWEAVREYGVYGR